MRTQRRQIAHVKNRNGDVDAIIPGIPDDVALLCLARLPSRVQAQTCAVSLCWKRAIESQVLSSLRLQLRTLETQVQPIATPSPCEVLFLSENGDELSRVDLFRRRSLCPSAPLMLTNRQRFASASVDGYVYAAGGYILKSTPALRYMPFSESGLKSVERLNCSHMSSWESLPDMHVARAYAAAVSMNGKLYVIGGKNKRERVYSGEIWDPEKQEWSLVQELWPLEVFDATSPKGKVAVVMGHLVAIKEWTHEVVVYEHSSKRWTSLGYLPFEMLGNAVVHLSITCMLFGLADELWVVVQRNSFKDDFWMQNRDVYLKETCILACRPFSEPLMWRRLPYCFDPSLTLWCAIQVTI